MKDKLNLKSDQSIWLLDSIETDFQRLYDHYRDVYNQNEWLRKENERLKSETYKDEELTKMKEMYDKMKKEYYLGFPITEEEHKKIKEWIDKQMKKHPGSGGAIGGRFTYEFLPTGVGTAGTIIDSFTGDKFTFQELG